MEREGSHDSWYLSLASPSAGAKFDQKNFLLDLPVCLKRHFPYCMLIACLKECRSKSGKSIVLHWTVVMPMDRKCVWPIRCGSVSFGLSRLWLNQTFKKIFCYCWWIPYWTPQNILCSTPYNWHPHNLPYLPHPCYSNGLQCLSPSLPQQIQH